MNWAESSDDESDFESTEAPPPTGEEKPAQGDILQPQQEPQQQEQHYGGGGEEEPILTPESLPPQQVQEDQYHQEQQQQEQHDQDLGPPPLGPTKDFVYPMDPPFTAFVGNLAFSIRNREELVHHIQGLVHYRTGAGPLEIVTARVATDKNNGNKPKGFGYIEVQTLDDLKLLLSLADGQSIIEGRTVKLDVAEPQQNTMRRQSSKSMEGTIDGSSFRGGRHSNRSSFSEKRPSLKLKPRTSSSSIGGLDEGSNSAIFGAGKARDDAQWESRAGNRRSSDSSRRQSNTERRASGRGGRGGRGGSGEGGRGEGGRGDASNRNNNNKDNKDINNNNNQRRRGGGGRGDGSNRNNQNNRQQQQQQQQSKQQQQPSQEPQQKQSKQKPKPAANPSADQAKKDPPKFSNSFAALGFDSDSD